MSRKQNNINIRMINNIFRSCICLLMLFACFLPGVFADEDETDDGSPELLFADPVNHEESYSAFLYNSLNGLPSSEANAIAETSDGFIYIGSYSGLARYDGNTFERMDTSTGVGNVSSLYTDSRDRLWIGTNDSGLALLENGEFRIWHTSDGLTSSKINHISEDGYGNIYAGTPNGITMITPDLELIVMDDPQIEGAYIDSMQNGPDGKVYCVTNFFDIFTIKNGRLDMYISQDDFSLESVTHCCPDPNHAGFVYLGCEGSEVYYGRFDRLTTRFVKYDISPLYSVSYIKEINDQIWICARNGIGVIDDAGFHLMDNLPMNNSVGMMMADYEGNLWFTSTRQGVMKIVANIFTDVFERYDMPEIVVNSTCLCRDLLFVGTDVGVFILDGDQRLDEYPVSNVKTYDDPEHGPEDLISYLDGSRIRSIIRDSKGRLWFSTWGSRGLLCLDNDELTVYSEEDGLISDRIRAVYERKSDGAFLVVGTGGVCVLKDGKVTDVWDREDGIEITECLTVSDSFNDDILVGSNGGGIYVINDDGLSCLSEEDGLSSGIIMRIKRDEKRNLFWIITSNSIAIMTPDYEITTLNHFPYPNNFDMYENSSGDMWITGGEGIYVVPADELAANGQMNTVQYTVANGLPCIGTSNAYCELTEDKDLYLAGRSGVVKVNIDTPQESVSGLKMSVPWVDADGERIFPDEAGNFTIPADIRKLTVYSYVFNYSLSDPQVTYYLDGFDRAPVTVKRSQLDEADYTNLPGGTYHFILKVTDSLGRETDNMLSVTITKKKKIYEDPLFYVFASSIGIILIMEANKRFLERKTRILEKKHKEEVEKERLNTELKTANQIQTGILPHVFPPFPDRDEFDIYALMDPAREVGGDFYDYYLIDDDHLCLEIADVSGKGIPASLLMMTSMAILQNNARLGQSPAEILQRTNETLCENNQMEMFVTVWIGILEISTGKIIAANAGHEYPAIMKNGTFSLLKDKHGFVIGGMEGAKYREYVISLEPGDKLFLYTDGVPEATAADNKMFTTDRMTDALNREPDAAPEKILKNVRKAVDDFVKDAEQFDDLTMLCIEYRGTAGKSEKEEHHEDRMV